ncbi:hypothetical protein [uncultured Alistipes sp.]|nr:hypothetical protein [uncultured Alistipes sp.]
MNFSMGLSCGRFRRADGVTHYDMDGPMLMLLDEGSLVAVFQAADSETK